MEVDPADVAEMRHRICSQLISLFNGAEETNIVEKLKLEPVTDQMLTEKKVKASHLRYAAQMGTMAVEINQFKKDVALQK